MATLTIRIDERMETELTRLAEASHRTKSDLAREMLRWQLSIRRFHILRAQALRHAEVAGYLTDEDVFRHVPLGGFYAPSPCPVHLHRRPPP